MDSFFHFLHTYSRTPRLATFSGSPADDYELWEEKAQRILKKLFNGSGHRHRVAYPILGWARQGGNSSKRSARQEEKEELRREMLKWVRQTPEATFLQVRAEALHWDREAYPQAQVCAAALSHASNAVLEDKVNQLTEQVSKLQALLVQQNQPPHRQQNKKVCYFCNIPGHIKKDCRKLKRLEQQQAGSTTNPFHQQQKKEKKSNENQAHSLFDFFSAS